MTSYLPTIIFTPEDVDITEKFIQIKNKGYYASGEQVTEVYNRVLHKNVTPTSCGSCIRQRISELEGALKIWQERQKKAVQSDKTENNEEKISEENGDKQKPQKAKGRKKKSESA